MGSDTGFPDERPRRRVYVKGFFIDKYEVTNRRFRAAGMKPAHSYGLSAIGTIRKRAETARKPHVWCAGELGDFMRPTSARPTGGWSGPVSGIAASGFVAPWMRVE